MRIDRPQMILMAVCGLILALAPNPACAQMLGSNFTGDFGLMSASQPGPGFYLTGMYLRYDGETLRDKDGNSIAIDPEEQGSMDSNSYAVGAWWVSGWKLFGGNYSAMIFPAFTNSMFEAPIIGLQEKVSTGFTDLYMQPLNLGWHQPKADYNAGIGLYAPTGRYTAGADDNLGLGMWSLEFFAGATVFFDEAKSWNLATTAFFETHSEKKDTDIKVGNILTLEGGLGKSFMAGGLNVGLVYYAQWKLTDDQLGADLEAELGGVQPGKHRGFGLGPEVTFAVASKTKLISTISARYFWETGVRSQLEGQAFVASATFPIPSVSLQ